MFPAIILFLARFQGRQMLTGEKVSSFSLRSEPLVSELIKAEHGFNCSYFHCIGVHTIQTLELTLNGFLFISSCASLNCVGHLIYNFDRIQFNLLQERIFPPYYDCPVVNFKFRLSALPPHSYTTEYT